MGLAASRDITPSSRICTPRSPHLGGGQAQSADNTHPKQLIPPISARALTPCSKENMPPTKEKLAEPAVKQSSRRRPVHPSQGRPLTVQEAQDLLMLTPKGVQATNEHRILEESRPNSEV